MVIFLVKVLMIYRVRIRCGAKWGFTKGKALGHKWRKWTIDPKSLLRGHKARLIRTCSRCGKKDYKYK